MDEVSGLGWQLFVDGRKFINQSALERCKITQFIFGGEGFREMDGAIAARFDRHGCQAAIVRPDHYVYCAVSEAGSSEEILRSRRQGLGLEGLPLQSSRIRNSRLRRTPTSKTCGVNLARRQTALREKEALIHGGTCKSYTNRLPRPYP